jgi:hypothetical protein
MLPVGHKVFAPLLHFSLLQLTRVLAREATPRCLGGSLLLWFWAGLRQVEEVFGAVQRARVR